MEDRLHSEIRDVVSSYVAGKEDLSSVQDWLWPLLADLEDSDDKSAISVAGLIGNLISEYSDGYMTEAELQEELGTAILPFAQAEEKALAVIGPRAVDAYHRAWMIDQPALTMYYSKVPDRVSVPIEIGFHPTRTILGETSQHWPMYGSIQVHGTAVLVTYQPLPETVADLFSHRAPELIRTGNSNQNVVGFEGVASALRFLITQ